MIAMFHLLFVLGGVAVALGTLTWFSRMRSGWWSDAGLLAVALLVVAALLILAGFGEIPFPGLATVTP